MKLVKCRIKNYKSIIDSGDCYFSDKLTILAGKNESGKTSILEALADFHQDEKIREEARPINGVGTPEVAISFLLTEDEVNDLFSEVDIEDEFSGEVTITLTKKYGDDKYYLDGPSRLLLKLPNLYNETKNSVIKTSKVIEARVKKLSSPVVWSLLGNKKLSDYKAEITSFNNQIQEMPEVQDGDKLFFSQETEKIVKAIDGHYNRERAVVNFIAEFVNTSLPYFILFSSFDDEFPKSINIDDLPNNEWAKDLEEVSSFKISKIMSSNDQDRRNHQQHVNAQFSEKFKKFWTQDDIKLEVEKEGSRINFWIVENGMQYYPTQRSKGQQWYLSFYIKIVARLSEDKPNVILIDEPGLYLHAKAQKDLLLILLEHTSDYPVVFSTHSPYLITEDNLENIRLIEKDKNGTKILGKIHAHPKADKETLTPILTAIGLGINDSITNLDQKNNVVVEGSEDVFYLQAFKHLTDPDLSINFVNGGSAGSMGIVGSILEGWGANVCYLYDNDKGKKDGEKNLKQNWKVIPELIKAVLKEENKTIADVLSNNDFKKFVLDNPALKFATANSSHIKNSKLEKVLLARKFLQKAKADQVSLDAVSKTNIANLFSEIEFKYDK